METRDVWKDKVGQIIHIGTERCHDIVPVYKADDEGNPVIDPETGEFISLGTKDCCPIPEGAYLTQSTGEWVEGYWVDEADLYKAQRKAAYPAIETQMDMIYHDGLEAWKAAIQAVKNKYPKPSKKGKEKTV